jgi:hypothetical protein
VLDVIGRALSCALSWSLATSPAQPAAAEPPAATTEPAPDLEQAKALYLEGKAKFDTYDYAGAIELWTRAYARLPDVPEAGTIRNNLAYNISTAQILAYEQDGDVVRLKRAKQLLAGYLDGLGSTGEEGLEQEIERVRARVAELDAQIEAAERPRAPAPTPKPAPSTDDRGSRKLAPLTIAGIALASTGVALSSGAFVGLALGRRADRRLDDQVGDELMGMSTEADRRALVQDGRTANRLAIGTAAAAGTLVLVGTILAIVGATRQRKRARAVAWWRP